ncbi:MAG TPA: insulinase family protein, partial [Sphingomonadales bacterium]
MIRLSQFVASLVAAALWLAFPARAMDVQVISVPEVGEVWLVENHNLPIVAVEIAFRDAGAAQDPADKAGLATFAAGLLDEGAGDMDAIAFRTRLEDLSIALSFEAGRDHFFGHMKTLSDNKAEAFRLLGLAVTAPRFEGEAVERVRNQLLAAIAQEEQQPGSVASRSWYARAFPDHPYG